MLLPIAFGLLGSHGERLAYEAETDIQSDVMLLSKESQTFTLKGLREKPVYHCCEIFLRQSFYTRHSMKANLFFLHSMMTITSIAGNLLIN